MHQSPQPLNLSYDKRSLLHYLGRRAKWLLGDRSPIVAYLKLTKRCNLDCYYCPWHTAPSDFAGEQETAVWIAQIDRLVERGIQIFVLEGGEPTLRPDLPVLIEYAHSLGAHTILATNGTGSIWRFQPTAFTVSIDGPELLHDQVRGRGTYRHILDNLAQRKNHRVVSITVITRDNMHALEEMATGIEPYVDAMLFTFVYPYASVAAETMTREEVRATKNRLLAMKRRFRILNPASHLRAETGAKPCYDWLAVTVNAQGKLEEGCFVQHVEPKDCSRCELGCFQVISSFHQFNVEAWFNLNRLLLRTI
ncbi:MAG TPA: radical SAM protein [Thermoanaerobaculia bacterium]|nr:radical SAM protein [Thermoanaerobaculia bacterium]